MSQRDYNQLYLLGRLAVQILQDGQHDGVTVSLIPGIWVSRNPRMSFVIGFNWICGDINIGIATKEFRDNEIKRRKHVEEYAAKQGLTRRQYELRWGW